MRDLLLTIGLGAMLLGCDPAGGPGSGTSGTSPSGSHFLVAVEQDGRAVPIQNAAVRLRPAPFTLIIATPDPATMFVNASREATSYEQAGRGLAYVEIDGFSGSAVREALGNPRKQLVVDDEDYHNWYYRGPTISKYDSVREVDEVFLMRRRVDSLRIGDRLVEMRNAEGTLYLVFAQLVWDESLSGRAEREKHRLKIEISR